MELNGFASPAGDETELDVYCPHCDVVHAGCPVVMYGRYLGTGECPETELTFEIDLTEELV